MIRVKTKRRQTVKNHRQRHIGNKRPRRKRAGTKVRTSPEGDMLAGIPLHVEPVRIVKMRRVTVCRAEHEKGAPASLDVHPANQCIGDNAAR